MKLPSPFICPSREPILSLLHVIESLVITVTGRAGCHVPRNVIAAKSCVRDRDASMDKSHAARVMETGCYQEIVLIVMGDIKTAHSVRAEETGGVIPVMVQGK